MARSIPFPVAPFVKAITKAVENPKAVDMETLNEQLNNLLQVLSVDGKEKFSDKDQQKILSALQDVENKLRRQFIQYDKVQEIYEWFK